MEVAQNQAYILKFDFQPFFLLLYIGDYHSKSPPQKNLLPIIFDNTSHIFIIKITEF